MMHAPFPRQLLRILSVIAFVALALSTSMALLARADRRPIDKEAQAKRRPAVCLSVFDNGYASGLFQADTRANANLSRTTDIRAPHPARFASNGDRQTDAIGQDGPDQLLLDGIGTTDSAMQSLDSMNALQSLAIRGTKITDAGLVHLRKLKRLEFLVLSGVHITDAGMENLAGLSNLTYLKLDGAEITDRGIKQLKGLTNLTRLELNDTKITGEALADLKGLKRLQVLAVNRTQVSDAGIASLAALDGLLELSLGDTKISDVALRTIKRLHQLTWLELRGYPESFREVSGGFIRRLGIGTWFEALATVCGASNEHC